MVSMNTQSERQERMSTTKRGVDPAPCDTPYEHRAHWWRNEGVKTYCRGRRPVAAPITPYPDTDGTKTSGWSGSEASHERAKTEDGSGTTQHRQTEALRLVGQHKHHGMTVKELRDVTTWHHGQASSALSVLHKDGLISRLAQRRDRCHVYVLAGWEEGREAQPHGRHHKPVSEELSEAIRQAEASLSLPSVTVQVHALRHALELALKELGFER